MSSLPCRRSRAPFKCSVYICVYAYIHIYIYTHTCIYIHPSIHRIGISIYQHPLLMSSLPCRRSRAPYKCSVYICVYAYIHIYTYIHIHTHACISIHPSTNRSNYLSTSSSDVFSSLQEITRAFQVLSNEGTVEELCEPWNKPAPGAKNGQRGGGGQGGNKPKQ